jgi:predicted ATPase
MMKKVGFKNFRRFQDFPALEYDGITFLVGRNNAGKSTLVKALLLLNDFFKSGSLKQFSFGNSVLEDANIVTYGRAQNKTAEDGFIKFYCQLENYQTEITITGEDDNTHAEVVSFLIRDVKSNIDFLFNSTGWSFTILRRQIVDENKNKPDLTSLDTEIKNLKSELDASDLKKTSKEYLQMVEEYNSLLSKREMFDVKGSAKPEHIYSLGATFSDDFDLEGMLGLMLHSAEVDHESDYHRIQRGEEPEFDFEVNRAVIEDKELIENSFSGFYRLMKSSTVIYLGANPSKQSALFLIRDRNNSLAQAIHEFYQLRIGPGTEAYEFVLKWMKETEFGVGEAFDINIYAGEAYEVKIHSKGAEIPLADKGMGSIQAMLLIFRLACIIHRFTPADNITIVIEEPELNLHPALQSKLAELFLDVHSRNINFIIETHSEYLIRKSQLIVKENDFEVPPNENPFKVYYFDDKSLPYRMNYREDGRFIESFGAGFFDVSANLTFDLL